MEILPCPFCGKKALMHPMSKAVKCSGEPCAGAINFVTLEYWNKRAPLPNDAFLQFKSSLDQEYTARIKAEALVKTLEGAIEEIIEYLSGQLPAETVAKMRYGFDTYKKSKEI